MRVRSGTRLLPFSVLFLQMACSGGPARAIYVFEGREKSISTLTTDAGRPVVEVKPVLVPDYLDTTDILVRDGTHQLKASPTGLWGERLSVGITNAVAIDLASRMPGIVVEQDGSGQQPVSTVLISVTSFDVWPDHRCVLTASWTFLGKAQNNVRGGEQTTIVTPVGGPPDHLADPAVVAAMSEAVHELTDRVATDLTQTLNKPGF
jgi:uncharacterized lipoprotein YmbA